MKLTEKKLKETLDKIAKALEKRPEVLAAYLYGSYAKGYARDGSDLDIGILLEPQTNYSLLDEGRFQTEFEDINGNKAETFIINGKSPLFRYGVMNPRRVIFCRDNGRRADFEVKTYNEYFEEKTFVDESYQAALERARAHLI